LCAKEIATIVREMHEGTGPSVNGQHRDGRCAPGRPLLDEATLSVLWNGKAIHLGHTHGFWLLARLSRSANQYVTHLDLIQEIWDNDLTDTAVLRAGVRRLRIKLRRGGMGDLADAIVGHHGRYILDLNGWRRHTEVTATSR
jgi:DNA-binding response OmpR family regulator